MTTFEGFRPDIRVLFVDIDGVFNSHLWWQQRGPEQRHFDEGALLGISGGVDPAAAERVLRLVARVDAYVVCHSVYSMRYRPIALREMFRAYGVRLPVHDCVTWDGCGGRKGRAISEWLARQRFSQDPNYVILDDEVSDMAPHTHRVVKVGPWAMSTGMQEQHVDEALELFRCPKSRLLRP